MSGKGSKPRPVNLAAFRANHDAIFRRDRCPKCNGEMQDGIALRESWTGSPDFPGETGVEPGCTINPVWTGETETCRKCRNCGYSTTKL